MALYYFLQNKVNKWILGTDDKFSAWNTFRDNAQHFDTKEDAEAKATALGLTEKSEVLKTSFPEKMKKIIKDENV